jgi:phage major head subunit gpT-like protein
MLTVNSMPQSLLPEVKALFNLGREQAGGIFSNFSRVTTILESNNEIEEMDAIGTVPTWRKWTDERRAGGFKEYKYNIKNYPWEHTISLDRRLLTFEKTGQIKLRATSAGAAFEKWLSKKVWSTFRAGSSLICYDGQYFFDTDHAWSGSNQSNYGGNSPLDATNLAAAMSAMNKFTDEQGQALGVRADLLIVGPDNEQTAWELTKSQYNTGTASFKLNYFQGLEYMVVPWISGVSAQYEWYLVDSTQVGAKPVIHTRVTPNPEITSQEKESYTGFNRNEYQYGGYYDGGFGVGDWFTAYKSGTADPTLATEVVASDYYAG